MIWLANVSALKTVLVPFKLLDWGFGAEKLYMQAFGNSTCFTKFHSWSDAHESLNQIELKNRDEYNTSKEKYTGKNQYQNNWSRRTVSDMEDRMVEITAMEQNKEKRMKRLEDFFCLAAFLKWTWCPALVGASTCWATAGIVFSRWY